jgi:hypothetical protein
MFAAATATATAAVNAASSFLGRGSPARPARQPPSPLRGNKRPASTPASPATSETLSIPQRNEDFSARVAMLERDNEELRGRVDNQDLQIAALELQMETQNIAMKSRNLMAFGIPANMSVRDIRRLFEQRGDLPSVAPFLAEIRRLGRPRRNANQSTPVRLIFSTEDARGAAWKYMATLRDRGISLAEDLTQKQLAERKRLMPQLHALKATGHSPFFRGANLLYRLDGKTVRWVDGASPPPNRAPPPPRAHGHPPRATSPPGTPTNQRIPEPEIRPASPRGSYAERVRQGSPVPLRGQASQRSTATGATGAATTRGAPAAHQQQAPGGRTAAATAGAASGAHNTAKSTAAAAAPPPPPPGPPPPPPGPPPPATGAAAAAPAAQAPAARPRATPGSRTAAAPAGQAAGVFHPQSRAAAAAEDMSSPMDWQQVKARRRFQPRPVRLGSKRIASQPQQSYRVRRSDGAPSTAEEPSTSPADNHPKRD